MPAGLYIHIPFCLHKCPYCDFYSVPFDADLSRKFVEAFRVEVSCVSEAPPWSKLTFSTLYVGGGTPTVLPIFQLAEILRHCLNSFILENTFEVTVEANPETIGEEQLRTLKESGVNRLSLGIQSLKDEELSSLGRIHTAETALNAYHTARTVGFENIGIDCIFGIPGQSLQSWKDTLKHVVDLGPEHISTYSLTIEPGTQFADGMKTGSISKPSEDLEAAMYEYAIDFLGAQRYEHYEISNFAKPDFRSRHNQLYWDHSPYLGLGPSAHSFIDDRRSERVRDVHEYIERIEQGVSTIEKEEILSKNKLMSEAVFLALRKREGLDMNLFRKKFGIEVQDLYGEKMRKYTDMEMLERKGSFLRLTRKGLMVANTIFTEFM